MRPTAFALTRIWLLTKPSKKCLHGTSAGCTNHTSKEGKKRRRNGKEKGKKGRKTALVSACRRAAFPCDSESRTSLVVPLFVSSCNCVALFKNERVVSHIDCKQRGKPPTRTTAPPAPPCSLSTKRHFITASKHATQTRKSLSRPLSKCSRVSSRCLRRTATTSMSWRRAPSPSASLPFASPGWTTRAASTSTVATACSTAGNGRTMTKRRRHEAERDTHSQTHNAQCDGDAARRGAGQGLRAAASLLVTSVLHSFYLRPDCSLTPSSPHFLYP